jgi:4-hydroxyphenylpyruvate dioxygenase
MEKNNPVGLRGVDHLEFTCDSLNTPTSLNFEKLGFTVQSENSSKRFFSQGQIRFLLNASSSGLSREYFNNHGEGVSKISFRVDNVDKSLETAISRGAKLVSDIEVIETEDGPIRKASIQGFGDVLNEFTERSNSKIFDPQLKVVNSNKFPLETRVSRIDHFTNNVPFGEMEHWVDFYKSVYGFVETRYFDIKGAKTGLKSKVVQLADNSIIIPINEPEVPDGKSQIQEYLDRHHGAGVQHIALMTPNIISTLEQLIQRDFKFLKVPDTYYEDIPGRGLNVTENLAELKKNQILVDGDSEGYLLQIFSDTYIGPLFFEFIQRKNHWGFGEGNFQALFDAIERDQLQRGYL